VFSEFDPLFSNLLSDMGFLCLLICFILFQQLKSFINMKTMKLFFVIVLASVFSVSMNAQAGKLKTETLKVLGNCDMCKNRIESAVKSEGASTASWDAKTKILTVSYDPSKTNVDALARKAASVGHDTEKYKADDKTYNSLPGCCKYDRSGFTASAGKSETKQMSHTHH
jgi:hypothetical protein